MERKVGFHQLLFVFSFCTVKLRADDELLFYCNTLPK